jgi:hypothetical protein
MISVFRAFHSDGNFSVPDSHHSMGHLNCTNINVEVFIYMGHGNLGQ